MSDLKLIDELLCDLRQELQVSWLELEQHTSVTRAAMARLREACASGEMSAITLGIANHFARSDPPVKAPR